jgi:Uma2 family endonuclease
MNLEIDISKTYSYSEYLKWTIEERLELIKGKIFKMSPAPSLKHQIISSELHLLLGNYLKNKPCKVFAAPFDVRLYDKKKSVKKDKDIFTVVQPDLCIICDKSKLDERGCLGAPDLIIEILSPTNTHKEMKEKFEIYEEAGVKEYWIVNYVERNVLIYKMNEEGKYIGLKPFVEEDTITTSLFPNLEVNLKEVFDAIDN